ncbi:uncharacterized protein PHALS_14993 [Plasmopara halstedii]|uniref:Uncharacterized protein n=1 Tax=Plasmopara halstedii TaxID=4781 RepID=A0A0P1AY13_PLAHL|nr:uncharacterized protein PHALS_14993 [Plasmopara halstedii]CEG47350.1 hypothetical protein PHALS_14993 [Plasmopara halstedii]|eukprot:XP_024583719.1 hypothetical protein PHALS_14993 [Plasmopara halstedii]
MILNEINSIDVIWILVRNLLLNMGLHCIECRDGREKIRFSEQADENGNIFKAFTIANQQQKQAVIEAQFLANQLASLSLRSD